MFCFTATEAHDHDGLPHTLEHLIFMGSEDYPFKVRVDFQIMPINIPFNARHMYCRVRLTVWLTGVWPRGQMPGRMWTTLATP